MNWKRLSPYAVPAWIRLAVVLLVGTALTGVLLVSDPVSLFRWLPIRPPHEIVTDGPDWMQHFIAYTVFAFVLRWYAAAKARWIVPVLIGAATVHAMATEFLQRFVPDRTSDLKDLFVNLVGIATGTLLCRITMWLWGAQQTDIRPEFLLRRQDDPRVFAEQSAGSSLIGLLQRLASGWRGSSDDALARASVPLRRVPVNVAATVGAGGSIGLSRGTDDLQAAEVTPPRVLNFAFLGGLCVAGITLLGTLHVVHGWQVKRNAGALRDRGQQAQADGDLASAKDYFSRYVGLVPGDVEARAEYGLLLDDSGANPRQVFQIYEDVLRSEPAREDIRRRQIEVAMEAGRHPDALAHVRFLKLSYPNDGMLDFQAGLCLEELAEYTEAVHAYESAILHEPNLIETWQRYAWLCQTKLDRQERAVELLDELVDRQSRNAQAWLIRCRFRCQYGSLDEALSDVNRALELAPNDEDVLLAASALAYERAGDVRSAGRDAEARRIVAESRQLLHRALEMYPDHVEMRLLLVQLETHFGSTDEAERQIAQLLEVSPRESRAQLLLADMRLEQGEFDAAKAAIDKLPRTPGLDALRLFLEGRSLLTQQKWPEAITTLTEAARISTAAHGLSERVQLALARCHEALGNTQERAAAFRRALKANPESLTARLGLADGLVRDGQADAAIAEFRSLQHLPQVRTQLVRLLILKNLQMPELARDWSEIERLLDQSKQDNSDPVNETLLRAELLAARGQLEDARQLIERARTTQTDRIEFWLALASLAEQSGDARQAGLWRGQALSVAGNAEQAETLLRKTLDENPGDFGTALALVRHLVRHDQTDRARQLVALLEQRWKLKQRPVDHAQCLIAVGDDSAGAQILKHALQTTPSDYVAARLLTELLLRHQKWDDATSLLSWLLKSEATLPASEVTWARRQMAVAAVRSSNPVQRQQALELLDRNAKEDSFSSEDTRARAFVLASSPHRADQEAAIKLLGELDDHQQLLHKDLWLQARLYQQVGHLNEADAQYRRLVAEVPDNAECLADFVRALIQRGQLEEAEQRLATLRTIGDRWQTLPCELQLASARGEVASAVATLSEAAGTADNATDMMRLAALGESLLQDDARAAAGVLPIIETMYREAARREAGHVFNLVRWLSGQNRTDDAFEVCRQEWTRLPVEMSARLSMSLLVHGSGRAARMTEIETRLLAALETQPRSLPLQTCLADLRCWQEQYREAEDLYRRVLATDSDDVSAMNNLAWLLAMRDHDLDDAQSLLDRAMAKVGPQPHLLDTRGCLLLALHRVEPALRAFTQSRLDGPSAGTMFHQAVTHCSLGDINAARAAYADAVEHGFDPASIHPLERPWLDKLQAAGVITSDVSSDRTERIQDQ